MRKLSKVSESPTSKKIELMIKVLGRTDSYLNSANTKSTILLSLASAIIIALVVNFEKIICLVGVPSDRTFLSLLILLILLLLIGSLFFSLKGITPYINPSEIKNTFSFVDISKGYESLDDYRRQFKTVSDIDFLNQLVVLNYNLSKALVSKYERQVMAITCIEAAACVFCFSIFIVLLANC